MGVNNKVLSISFLIPAESLINLLGLKIMRIITSKNNNKPMTALFGFKLNREKRYFIHARHRKENPVHFRPIDRYLTF